MRTGALRHRVAIQNQVASSPSQNAIGEDAYTWADVATVPAAIEPLKGRELIAAQATQSEATGTIRLRYRSDVTAKSRIVFGSRIFDVLGVINTRERNWELVLLVKEGPNNG